jgi:hypothetical protein
VITGMCEEQKGSYFELSSIDRPIATRNEADTVQKRLRIAQRSLGSDSTSMRLSDSSNADARLHATHWRQ